MHRNIDVKLAHLRKFCNENKINLENTLKKHDKEGTGFVSSVVFKYIMAEVCKLKSDDYKMLTDFLASEGD